MQTTKKEYYFEIDGTTQHIYAHTIEEARKLLMQNALFANGDKPVFTNLRERYTLKVTETKNKAGKYHYQVIDSANGQVISERKSNRQYVACTINGTFYFGRLDLIGKGDHGKQLKRLASVGTPPNPIAYVK